MAAFGCLLIGPIADKWGRRWALAIASIVFIVGVCFCILSSSFFWFFIGRMLIGLGIGCAVIATPLLLCEICPADLRGVIVGYTELTNNLGIFLGFFIGYFFYLYKVSWRFMIGAGMILPVINLFLVIFYIPESPRWLII